MRFKKRGIKHRKAQVTVFIIIGLVIVISFVLFMFFRSDFVKPKGLSLVTEQAPSDFKPVQAYITSCLDQVATEALFLTGRVGGHLEMTDSNIAPNSYIYSTSDPTESDALVVSSDEGIILPYWYYMSTPNNCGFCEGCEQCITTLANVPEFEEIQYYISRYIQIHINDCLRDFKDFEEQNLFVKVLGDPEVETLIAEDDVVTQMYMPVGLSKGDLESQLNYYNVKLNLDFQDIYFVANEITNNEGKNRFLEKLAMSIISIYQGEDPMKLPPMSLSKEGYTSSIWFVDDVKTKVQELLRSYLPMISIENTKNAQSPAEGDTLQDKFYQQFFLNNQNATFQDYSVRFYYNNWPIHLYVSPSVKGVIEPSQSSVEAGKMPVSPPTEMIYNHFYDVGFPVLVEVRDDTAFDNHGYSFFFPLEANIKDNRDILSYMYSGILSDYDPEKYFEITNLDKLETPIDIEQNPDGTTNIVTVNVQPPAKVFLCDKEQRIGSEVQIRAIDLETKEPLEGAGVFYNCNRLGSCLIGTTNYAGEFKGKLPICIGGSLKIEYGDYYPYVKNVDSEKGKFVPLPTAKMSVPYTKIVTFRLVNVSEIILEDYPHQQSVRESIRKKAIPIPETDEYMVTLIAERQKKNSYEKDFVQYLVVDKDFEDAPLQMVPGDYKLKIMVSYNKPYQIVARYGCDDVNGCDKTPQGCEKECGDDKYFLQCKECNHCLKKNDYGECTEHKTIDENIDIEQYMIGMLSIDENLNAVWNAQLDELKDPARKLVFYIPYYERPLDIADLSNTGNLYKYNSDYWKYFRPQWVESSTYKPPEELY